MRFSAWPVNRFWRMHAPRGVLTRSRGRGHLQVCLRLACSFMLAIFAHLVEPSRLVSACATRMLGANTFVVGGVGVRDSLGLRVCTRLE